MVLHFRFNNFAVVLVEQNHIVFQSITMPLFEQWLRGSFTSGSLSPPA